MHDPIIGGDPLGGSTQPPQVGRTWVLTTIKCSLSEGKDLRSSRMSSLTLMLGILAAAVKPNSSAVTFSRFSRDA